jgi:hypothetical protein
MAFMKGSFPLEKAQSLIAGQDDTKEYFLAVQLPDRTLIGAMDVIDHPDGSIEVGYWFGVDYQGNGYASEALRGTLAPRPIFAECRPDNAPSIRLLTKTDFTQQDVQAPGPTGSSSGFDKVARVRVKIVREFPRRRPIKLIRCHLILPRFDGHL